MSTLKPVEADLASYERLPATAQTEAPAYRLAFVDPDFMRREELRGVRLQLELLKPELVMQARGIASTVIFFGGARIPEPGAAPKAKTETARRNLEAASRYYDEARALARLASTESLKHYGREFVVTTGGGPGIMEAGNRGAADVGASSIGLSIVLPHEEAPNSFVTPDLCFNFHYFAIRKMHFLMRAKAIAIFPGGFGTLDELFEALTLIQTERMEAVPIVLFGKEFWRKIINFDALVEAGTISPEDLDIFTYVETAEEAWRAISEFHGIAD
ncbi:MAG: LOG family protein [Pseudomonadota bacterium]